MVGTMSAQKGLWFLALWGVISLTPATRINSVCTPATQSTGKARPKLSSVFRVNVECSMQEQNRTVFVREFFDYGNNRGRITQYDELRAGDAFFDYNNNQIVLVDTDTLVCIVGALSTSDDRWMFGYRTGVQGQPHVFGASGALHFGNDPETYIGTSVVRGILVHQWDSCQYSDALNATMKVSWYFSDKADWDMQLGARSVPVRATAVGKQYRNGRIVPFNHTYDLFRFEEYVYDEDFEIPVGVVCPGRENTKPFPQIPDRFSFIGEVLDYDATITTYVEESYDDITKINVFRYKDTRDYRELTSIDRILQVNDYNSGLSYIIDTDESSCQVSQLGTKGFYLLHYVTNGNVVMKTPAQFLADDNMQYTYVGVRKVRNIRCELWISKTDKIQGYTDRNLTVEWYFAVRTDGEEWKTEDSDWQIPVQFRMWDSGATDPLLEYNVFYYDTTRPKLIGVDLSSCFPGAERRRFTFDVDGKDTRAVFNNIELFKYALISAVSTQAGISQLRVADVEVYYDVNVIHVSFDLLDKSSTRGDVSNVTKESDLTTAVNLYNSAMTSGGLQLNVTVGSDVKTVLPVPGSSAEIGQSSGYSTGVLAGLGVAMLVVGSAGGAGGAFLFFR